MADDLEPIRILVRDDRKIHVIVDDVGGIDELAVDAPGERRLAQSRANAARDLVHRHRVIESALAAIGQCDYGHRFRT